MIVISRTSLPLGASLLLDDSTDNNLGVSLINTDQYVVFDQSLPLGDSLINLQSIAAIVL